MAPPPEYDKEPKAPDKCALITTADNQPYLQHNDHPIHPDIKTSTPANNVESEDNKDVEALDDGQLRALLDEAITYKCPKDREGKSSLFKELLEEVEQDEQACEAAARTRRGAGASNSLQDLVAALAAEPAPRRHRPAPRDHAPVSARAHHGGSLPSGVDTSFLLGEEPPRVGGYVATVRCVNPSPLTERRVSASDAHPPLDDPPSRSKMAAFPMTYTARATLEIGSGGVAPGRAVTTTTASNQVDSGIPFSCITTPEVVTNCNTTSSTQPSAVAVDPKPRAAGPASPAAADEHRKSLDENGNSVQGASSPPSSQPKKVRRKKTTKNETVINPQEIDGYQGNKDLNEVLRFIESNAEHGRSKLPRTKHRDDADDKGKKRRKDKERGKRASSLEERSRTTLASLTDPAPPAPPAAPERRSWGDDAFYYQPAPAPLTPNKDKKKTKPGVDQTVMPDPPVETALELLDFQTVTKKKKQRRRTEESVGAGAGGARAASPGRRRTAPPSDKSNDSNDDLDSVHSAPDAAEPAPDAAPRGASYADIARTRHNIPDLIESCNYYTDGEAPPPAPAYDADSYPALAGGGRAARGGAGGGRGKPVLAPPAPAPAAPAPDVVTADRPPVILLDEAAPRDMDGVTFGFDVNEQLLEGARRRCDLVAAAEPPAPPAAAPPPAPAGAVRVTPRLRYRPPPAPAATAALRPIVDYVGNAWEDIMKCGGGKVRYFAE